jgi:hypothetical protein
MKSAVLNVSIDTATPQGEKLRDLILSTEYFNAWMCVSWVDRSKYNQPELLRESEDARMKAVEQAVELNKISLEDKKEIEELILKLEILRDRVKTINFSNRTLEAELSGSLKEIDRLRHIIVSEGAKWKTHHDDHQKKAYWELFMQRAKQ